MLSRKWFFVVNDHFNLREKKRYREVMSTCKGTLTNNKLIFIDNSVRRLCNSGKKKKKKKETMKTKSYTLPGPK